MLWDYANLVLRRNLFLVPTMYFAIHLNVLMNKLFKIYIFSGAVADCSQWYMNNQKLFSPKVEITQFKISYNAIIYF